MNHEQQINEFYDIVFNLIKELEGFKKTNAQLQDEIILLSQENQLLKQKLEKYRTPKNSGNSSKPPSSDLPKLQKTQSLRTPSGKNRLPDSILITT